VCLPLVTWLTGCHSRALCLPAVHPWRDPCRRVSGDGMRLEPSLMHPEGGSWTAVRTHTPSKLSKVQRTFVSHPLGLLQVSGERITAPLRTVRTPRRCIRPSILGTFSRGCTFQPGSIRMPYFSSMELKDCLPSPQRLAFVSVTTAYTLADPAYSGCSTHYRQTLG
jgi:hypothetical protein